MNPAGGGGIGAMGILEGGGGGTGGGGGAAAGVWGGGIGEMEVGVGVEEVVESAGATLRRSDKPETRKYIGFALLWDGNFQLT